MILARMVIPTDKFDETVNFYQTIFDLPFAIAGDEAIAKIDNFLVNIVKTDIDSVFSPTGNGMYFSFLFSDLVSTQKRIPKPNLLREWDENGIKVVLAKDPNNNLILLKQLTDGLPGDQDSFEVSSIKVSFLSSFIRSFAFAIQDLIAALREYGYRDDVIQKIAQSRPILDEFLSNGKRYLSKVPQTLDEKKDFDLYYAQSSQTLQLIAGDLEKLLDVISPIQELFDKLKVQKAIGISRSLIEDSKYLLILGSEKQ